MAIKRVIKKIGFWNWEYLWPALAVLSLSISSIMVSAKKFFWNDELLSFYLLNDRSLSHMLVAWSDKFNQAPPLYFILGWAWDKIFGSTELSLRLCSSVCMSLACLMIWRILRRTYDFWSTTVGTLSVFCLSELVLYHNAEVRMYGLFTAACAWGFWQFDTLNRQKRVGWQPLALNALAHSTIVLTHLYGLFYSLTLVIAAMVCDRYAGTFRQKVYLSSLIGWLPLLPLAPLLINQSNNGAKWFYAFKFTEMLNLLIPVPKFAWLLLALLGIAAFLTWTGATGRSLTAHTSPEPGQFQAERSLLILAFGFMMVPFVTWIITVTMKPLLNDRYLIPTLTIAWTILLTDLIARIMPPPQPTNNHTPLAPRFSRLTLRAIVLGTLTISFLLYPIVYAKKFSEYTQKPGGQDAQYGHLELPIALEAGHDFLSRFHYAGTPNRYFHILDWDTAIQNVTSPYAVGDYIHVNALSTHYPMIQSVQSTDFLKQHDRFLVLNETDQKWFETRVQSNPAYQVKSLGVQPGANAPLTMFLVERRQ